MMTIDRMKELYTKTRGTDDLDWQTVFEDTPEEQSFFLPGYTLQIEDAGKLFRGILHGESELTVQSENVGDIPFEAQLSVLSAALESPSRGSVLFCTALGRLILLEEECDVSASLPDFSITRCNIIISWSDTDAALKITQDGTDIYNIVYDGTDGSRREIAALLLSVTGQAMTSMQQDDVLEAILQTYPDLFSLERHIDAASDNAVELILTAAAQSDPKRRLWVMLDRESATVGIYPTVLCDDISLSIKAVGRYIDSILQEKVMLVTEYKSEERYNAGEHYSVGFAETTTPEDVEGRYAKKGSGLGKLVNKGKIIDIFSWNGTYDMALRL